MKKKKSVVGRVGVATGALQRSSKFKESEVENKDEDLATWLSRRQVAEMVGVSISAVRRMEGKSLHPRLVQGMWLFGPDEVGRMQKCGNGKRQTPLRSEGDIAAEIFNRFKRGRGLCQIVEELHLPPERVRALYREWNAPLGEEPERAGISDEEALARWEKQMRQQMADAEALDRSDREERLARLQRARRGG